MRRITLAAQDEEQTVVRFTLDQGGEVQDINQLQKTLTPYAMESGAGL